MNIIVNLLRPHSGGTLKLHTLQIHSYILILPVSHRESLVLWCLV